MMYICIYVGWICEGVGLVAVCSLLQSWTSSTVVTFYFAGTTASGFSCLEKKSLSSPK